MVSIKNFNKILVWNLLIGIIIGCYGCFFNNHIISINWGCILISLVSLGLLIMQLTILYSLKVNLISTISFFIIACYLFCFGEYYVVFLGHENLLIYPNWFKKDFVGKYQSAIFSLASIQFIFIGIYYWLKKQTTNTKKFVCEDVSDIQWLKIGLIFLVISLPCRLIFDYMTVLKGKTSMIYSGGPSLSGIIDDFQLLFIPGLMCILHSIKKKKSVVFCISFIVLLVEIYIMAQSGNRRLYVTSIAGIVLFLYYEYPFKKNKLIKFLIIGILGLVFLNFIELIRKYRFVGLGKTFFAAIDFTELFSSSVIIDCFAEFGLTSHSIYLAFANIKNLADFYWGQTFITSIIYTIPFGFIIDFNPQGSEIVAALSGSTVGGSIVTDLYVNWGWFSLFFAPFLGAFIAKISYNSTKLVKITTDNIFTFMIFPFVLGYARGDFFELSRPVIYTFILLYICKKLVLEKDYTYISKNKMENTVKIVFTTHSYWPKNDGVQYVTQYLSEGLLKKGYEIVVFTPQDSKKTVIKEYHNGILIVRPYFKQKFSFVIGNNKYYKKSLLAECSNADFLINCAVQSPFNNCALNLLKKIKSKKILYLHGVYNSNISLNLRTKEKIKKIILNIRWYAFYHMNVKNFRRYDYIINITNNLLNKNFFPKLGVNIPTTIINNAVEDFSNIEAEKEDLITYPILCKKYFLEVANYYDIKNQLMLIKAYSLYQEKTNSDIELVLIGKESEYSKECEVLISTLNCKEKIHLYKNFSRRIAKVFIKNCYCGVMASTCEVFPIFLAEIISCNHPFVSTNVGSVNEIEGGLIVNDIFEYVEALEKIDLDSELYKNLSISGKKYADKNFCQSEKINELEKLLLLIKNSK